MTDPIPPSGEVERHARQVDGTCGDASCPACRFADIFDDIKRLDAEVRLAFGELLLEVAAALVIEARAELGR